MGKGTLGLKFILQTRVVHFSTAETYPQSPGFLCVLPSLFHFVVSGHHKCIKSQNGKLVVGSFTASQPTTIPPLALPTSGTSESCLTVSVPYPHPLLSNQQASILLSPEKLSHPNGFSYLLP